MYIQPAGTAVHTTYDWVVICVYYSQEEYSCVYVLHFMVRDGSSLSEGLRE
jgi:hypothetical protein